MDEEKKKSRYARWEEIGEEAIRADMATGGYRLVGGSPEVRRLAQQWLNENAQAREEQAEQQSAEDDERETKRFRIGTVLAVLGIIVAIVLFFLS